MNKNKQFYSQVVSKILDKDGRLKIARQIAGVINVTVSDSIKKYCLDVGCSSGVITLYLAKHFKKIIGIDIDEVAINYANKNDHKSNVSFKLYKGQRIPFKDSTFEVVVCNQVFGYTDNPVELISEIWRVLKPQGQCIVSVRNRYSFIEGQSGLPLLHFLPISIGIKVAQILDKEYYPPKLLTLNDTNKLFSLFQVENITPEILKKPNKYKFQNLKLISSVFNLLPGMLQSLLLFFVPNYYFLLTKGF